MKTGKLEATYTELKTAEAFTSSSGTVYQANAGDFRIDLIPPPMGHSTIYVPAKAMRAILEFAEQVTVTMDPPDVKAMTLKGLRTLASKVREKDVRLWGDEIAMSPRVMTRDELESAVVLLWPADGKVPS